MAYVGETSTLPTLLHEYGPPLYTYTVPIYSRLQRRTSVVRVGGVGTAPEVKDET